MIKILLFIPAKNEATTIASVITDSKKVVQQSFAIDLDVLVIDDGSTDDTKKLAEQNGATVIRHNQSVGLGSIFKEAVQHAVAKKYDYLVTIDGDKQFNEQEIPSLLQPIFDGHAQFTSGNRFLHGNDIQHMSKTKKVGNSIVAKMVNHILNARYTDVSCGFRAYSREALLHLNLLGGYTYTQEVFLNLGFKNITIQEVPISVTYFPSRKSRIAHKIFNYGYQVLKIILSSLIYYKPMKFFGTLSMFLWLVTIPVMGILTYRYMETGLISPYKAVGILSLSGFILSLILLLVGVILYSLSRQQMSIDNILYYAKQR